MTAATEKQRALVIGGSGSLGAEICRTLVNQGFDLVFTYFKQREKAEKLCESLQTENPRVYAQHLDLCHPAEIQRVTTDAATQLGGLDALVIASGLATGQEWLGQQPTFMEVTPAGFDRMMAVNVRGAFFASRAAAEIMMKNGGGKIVITGSIDGVKPVPAPVDYACCKGALWGLTQSLSKELGPQGILVNMIAPGLLAGGIGNLLAEKLREEYIKHCSLKRLGTFAEIARMVAFLVGHKNTYLTGQAVVLDGGL